MTFLSSLGRARRVLAALLPLAPCFFLPAPVQAQADTDPSTAGLGKVVVTASRTPQPLSSVLADVSILEREDIERSGLSGMADLLARLPGIEFARNGGPGTATSVFVRGAEARYTAVYLDGVRIDSQSTGGAVWEQLPLDQIDRIEVLRGPAAAVYGSDAVAGVVQLFTRRGQGAAQPTVALTAGSANTLQGQAGVSGSVQALDYALSATRGRSSGFDARTAAVNHQPDRDGWERSALQGRLGYQLNTAQRLEASLLATHLNSDYDSSLTADDRNRHSLRSGRLAWQAGWSEQARTQVQLGTSRSTYETQPSFYRTETTLQDLTLQHEQRLSAAHHLTTTLERRTDELFNPAGGTNAALTGRRHQDAIGLGWRGDFGAHGLQAHLRHDEDSEFGGKSTGSLAWGWHLTRQWRLSASTATSFRAPTLYQRFSQYGNAALVPESGRNMELALRWAAAGHEASLTTWRNRVTHLINFGAPGPCASTFGCYENVGRAQLDGITLAARTRWAGVALRGSLDWHDPRNADTDRVLQRRARQLATFGAETVRAGWTLGTEVQAAGRRYENAANTQSLGGYALVNLFVSTPLRPDLVLQARLDNLTDKHYELARTYATAGRNGQVTLRWALR